MWFVAPFVVFGYAFPVGPDGPVYLWWTRLAGFEALSAVERPGTPALALTLSGAFGLPISATLAALEAMFGVAVGTATAALVRRTTAPWIAWPLAGLLAGTFAVHLAAGYLANLALAATFVAAAVLLSPGTRAGAVGAAVVLGAGGLAHPLFLLVAIAILFVTALLEWRLDHAMALRTIAGAAGAGAIGGVAWLLGRIGPQPLDVDTSRDAFLRRVGLTDVLRSAYLDRLVLRWTRYVQWASIPLAVIGVPVATGFVGRFLIAWFTVTLLGVALGAITGAFPPDRFITFGFAIPILAALGIVRLPAPLEGRRTSAIVLGAVLTIAMLAGAWIAWARQEPFIDAAEVHDVEDVGRYAVRTGDDVAIVFEVNDGDGELSFEATRVNNVIRAALPPSLIRRAYVEVGPPDGPVTEERRALTGVLAPGDDSILDPEARTLVAYIRSFGSLDGAPPLAREVSPDTALATSGGTLPEPAAEPSAPLEPASTLEIVLGALVASAATGVAGYGPARVLLRDTTDALAVAPAVGAAVFMLVAFAGDRLGLPLTGTIGPVAVSAVAIVGGLAFGLVGQRRTVAEPTP